LRKFITELQYVLERFEFGTIIGRVKPVFTMRVTQTTDETSESAVVRQVMIVDDDRTTVDHLSNLLTEAGYSFATVNSGRAALQQINAQQTADLVLLDITLPDMHGLELLRRLRERSFVPIIVIVDENLERSKVAALEMGADDVMINPFSGEELIARIGALFRRIQLTPPAETLIAVRQLELDMTRRLAVLKERKLHLTPIEYGILATLMQLAGTVITHDDLLKAVWGDTYDGGYSVLRVNISRLRQKLEENPRQPSYIVTVPGQGYIMPTHHL
jgi:two-component system, OmpR family, KDP operon response regulator KdpE